MATIVATVTNARSGDSVLFVWTPMLNGDVGDSQHLDQFGDRSVQVTGTFGAGGSATLEGSNDGSNWTALKDPSSTTIAITAAGIKQVLETTRYVRGRVTAGDGTTSLTVTIYGRRTYR